ncbi:MAG TPA: nitroreductase family deazaflavin-dependent oxidoreductase [Pseudonocardiaceae bacterium]|nr:nitroreductase family deazaflavin-dependent oxidoreductase [Pseudonocardiaceae bacterium]
MSDGPNDFNSNVVTEFRENGGKVGGMFAGMPILLVHHIGAKSGTERVSPVAYLADGDRIFIFASKGGADENPAWYHNLVANPTVTAELGTETFQVTAVVLTGAERDEIFAKQAAAVPQFGEYEKKTTRTIPVVELRRAG